MSTHQDVDIALAENIFLEELGTSGKTLLGKNIKRILSEEIVDLILKKNFPDFEVVTGGIRQPLENIIKNNDRFSSFYRYKGNSNSYIIPTNMGLDPEKNSEGWRDLLKRMWSSRESFTEDGKPNYSQWFQTGTVRIPKHSRFSTEEHPDYNDPRVLDDLRYRQGLTTQYKENPYGGGSRKKPTAAAAKKPAPRKKPAAAVKKPAARKPAAAAAKKKPTTRKPAAAVAKKVKKPAAAAPKKKKPAAAAAKK